MKRMLTGLAIIGAMLLMAPIGRAAEEKKPDATVKMSGKSVAAGVGYSWGSGVLTYEGKDYPFSVSGLSAGNIGAGSAELSGQVFNLKKLADFGGNFTSVGAGATVAGGGGAMSMKNQNGVVMNVAGTSKGLTFKLGVDGIKVELKK
ncbi:MAG: DUF1134 domain-containing protein [Candidatus Binatia bacterium]